MTSENRQTEQIIEQKYIFRGNLSTFEAENTTKIRPFMVESKAQPLH